MGLNGNASHTTNLNCLKGKIHVLTSIDPTLSHEGCSADAKAVGDAIADIKEKLTVLEEIIDKLNEVST